MSKKWPTWICVPINIMYFCGVLIVMSDVVPLVWGNIHPRGLLAARLEGLMLAGMFGAMALQYILDAMKALSEYLDEKELNKKKEA